MKRDLIKFTGNIPIYSANVKSPVGFHSKSNIASFENNFVLWGIDGDFEFNAISRNNPFVSTDHCGVIRVLSDDILPEYLMIQLEIVRHKYGFDRGLRASLKNIKDIAIKLPFNTNGSINIEKQKEIIEKYEYIRELKGKIVDYKDNISALTVDVEK